MIKKKSYFGFKPKYSRYMELEFSAFREQAFSQAKFRHLTWFRKLRDFKRMESFGKIVKDKKNKKLNNIIEYQKKEFLVVPMKKIL